jgi:hypothetical protein
MDRKVKAERVGKSISASLASVRGQFCQMKFGLQDWLYRSFFGEVCFH